MRSLLELIIFRGRHRPCTEAIKEEREKDQPKINLLYTGYITKEQSLTSKVIVYCPRRMYSIVRLGDDLYIVDYSGRRYRIDYS
jgi:hypothetical protein